MGRRRWRRYRRSSNVGRKKTKEGYGHHEIGRSWSRDNMVRIKEGSTTWIICHSCTRFVLIITRVVQYLANQTLTLKFSRSYWRANGRDFWYLAVKYDQLLSIRADFPANRGRQDVGIASWWCLSSRFRRNVKKRRKMLHFQHWKHNNVVQGTVVNWKWLEIHSYWKMWIGIIFAKFQSWA